MPPEVVLLLTATVEELFAAPPVVELPEAAVTLLWLIVELEPPEVELLLAAADEELFAATPEVLFPDAAATLAWLFVELEEAVVWLET